MKFFRPQIDAKLKNKLHAAALRADLQLREYLSQKLSEVLNKEMSA